MSTTTRPVVHDVAVIGAGMTGCAVTRALTLAGLSCVLVDAGPDILCGASKADPGWLRTGFDLPAAGRSLEAVRRGRAVFQTLRDQGDLPALDCGALVPARTAEEWESLPALQARAQANGAEAHLLDAAALQARQPGLSPRLRGALHLPGEAVIDPWSTPLYCITQALQLGASVRFRAEIAAAALGEDDVWTLTHGKKTLRARMVVNCAGVRADQLEALRQPEAFVVHPRKDEFLCWDKAAPRLLGHILLPPPGSDGVALSPTLFGNVLAGPVSHGVKDRANVETTPRVLKQLEKKGVALLPALEREHLAAGFARVRPANQDEELLLEVDAERRWIALAGLATLGVAGALGAAEMLAEAMFPFFPFAQPVTHPVWPSVPVLSEYHSRPWQRKGPGDIVCHCEKVTVNEVEAALASPLPPGDWHGLKRRTRAGMGLCQGDGCGHALLSLAVSRLAVRPPFVALKKKKQQDDAEGDQS